jgi:Holliday junction resolvase RusA-like endonuclease
MLARVWIELRDRKPEPASYRLARGRMFEADSSREWKALVRDAAIEAMNGEPIFEGPLRLNLRVTLTRPKSHWTTKHSLSAEGRRHLAPTTKPDLTSLLRAVEDALTHVVYADDSQIAEQGTAKVYGERPGIEVEVVMLDPFELG